MSNLKVNNYHHLKFSINYEEYWDFYVNHDPLGYYDFTSNTLFDDCLIAYIDMCDDECIGKGNWIYSKDYYQWEHANTVDHTMYDITYTGLDNGLVTYRKDRITNQEFFDIYTKSYVDIVGGDNRLKLHAVSGNTLQYEYPLSFEECQVKLNGGFFQGFFKTDCDKYQVLPSTFNSGDVIHFEFELSKQDFEKESEKTLNDKYPDNKGFFFYIGARAENKWVYLYDDADTEGQDDCLELGLDDFVEDGEIDKKDYIIGDFYDPVIDWDGYDPFELGDYTDYNYYPDDDPFDDFIDYSKKPVNIGNCCGVMTDDVVIPFFRGCGCPIVYKHYGKKGGDIDNCSEFGDDYIDGFDGLMSVDEATDYVASELDISDFDYETYEGLSLRLANQYYFYTDNKFLLFDRTKNGYQVKNWVEGTTVMYQGRRSRFKGNLFLLMHRGPGGYTVRDIDELRQQDDNYYNPYNDVYNNALGFRITDDGEIGYRMLTVDCEKEGRDKIVAIEGYSEKGIIKDGEWYVVNVKMVFTFGKMKIFFYVNGKLVYVTKDLPALDLRKLKEVDKKQEGVPYNISIGGGSQGLAETILPNYMFNPNRIYPIEQYFAGSFIGYIKAFRMYGCMVEPGYLKRNYKWFVQRLKTDTAIYNR